MQERLDQAKAVQKAVFERNHSAETKTYGDLIASLQGILPQDMNGKGLAYDISARPEAYAFSYVARSLLYEKHNVRCFKAVPQAKSSILRHVLVDTIILVRNILGQSKVGALTDEKKKEYWSQIFNLRNKAFKSKADAHFNGIIQTDGISLCVVHGPLSQQKRQRKDPVKATVKDEEAYVEEAPGEVKNDYVVIDPNKRDLLYCLGSKGEKLRYTQQQRAVETRSKKYRKIREKLTTAAGMDASPFDVRASKTTCDREGYNVYIREFFSEKFQKKEKFYSNVLFRKLRLNAYINAQKSEAKFLKKFKDSYGDGRQVSIIMGDWDAGGRTPPGQVSTKGKGFRYSNF